MTTLETVRQSLATAVETAGYKAHEAPLATVIPPAVVIVPDDPYLEVDTLAAGGLSWQANYELIVCVTYLDNRGSLRELEHIIVDVAMNLPRGCELDSVQQPTVEEVGPSSLLTARIGVSIRANLSAP